MRSFIPVSQEIRADTIDFGPLFARRVRWSQLGFSPWPNAGFSPHAQLPEVELCDCCGRPLDDEDTW